MEQVDGRYHLWLEDLALIGMMGNTERGERMGGMLVVLGHPPDAILPRVEERSWIEYGPDKSDRRPVNISPGHAIALKEDGWLECCGHAYACTHYTLTEKAWKYYLAFLEWREQQEVS